MSDAPRILLDACVLFPTVMREVLIGVARQGAFKPLWSPRILEEWARATRKLGPVAEEQARGEVALLSAEWPRASFLPRDKDVSRLWLPDVDDVHVLASAIAGSADLIMTVNTRDFPRNTLREEGLDRIDPDGFLHQVWLRKPDCVERVVLDVRTEAERLDECDVSASKLLKKARLPRLAKAFRQA